MSANPNSKKTIFVVYYSMYGHVRQLAIEVLKGLERAGVNAELYQVAETLPEEVLTKMNAQPKADDVPIIQAKDLVRADGILFGIPTRFGMVPAQMKALIDSCGQLWMSGALENKFVGSFVSTGSIAGGQETTVLTLIPFFSHMGMIYVPFGSKARSIVGSSKEALGGSSFGAGTFAYSGLEPREVHELELKIAEAQGYDFGSIVSRFH